MTCHHCESAPATSAVTWCVAPTAIDEAKTFARRLCDDCANDLRVSARKPRGSISRVTIQPI